MAAPPTVEPVRHPWNVGFAWRSPQGPFLRVTEEQAVRFDEHGYVVLEDVVDPGTVARVIAELDRFEASVDAFLGTQPDGRMFIAETGAITFSPHLVAQSATLRALSTSPPFAELCADLVGPDVDMYWDQAVYKKPEKPRRFPWHQDNGYTFVEPQQYLTCWLALTDATVDNGCPWVVPGLHRMGTLAHRYVEPLGFECFAEPPAGCTAVAAPVRAGGVVVFSSLTPHLTGPNTTTAVRKAYILQYAHAGSAVLEGDPASGPPTARVPCDAPGRQYPAARDGVPVRAAEGANRLPAMGNVFASAEGAGFADIDATTDPAAFIAYLDEARARLGEAKLDGYAMFGVAPGQRLLDVGCGTGDDVIALAHMVGPAGHVTGVDASAAMLDEARRRAGAASAGNVEFVAGDAAKLDFPDSTFDGARADRVLQHVADPAAVIAEMARVVRPGGRVMTVDPDHTIVSVDAADDETAECILRTRAVQVRNPRIGRQLRGLFLDAGIDHVELVVRPMLFTDLAAFRAMFSLDASAQQAVELGLAPADAVRRCLDDLEARDRRGRFFAAAFGFRIVGRKPS